MRKEKQHVRNRFEYHLQIKVKHKDGNVYKITSATQLKLGSF